VVRTFQNVRLFKDMTAVENLLIAQHRHLNTNFLSGLFKTPSFRKSEREAMDFAEYWLEKVNLKEFANRPAGTLAYGQQRRLEIARCMMTRPRILMLDEPAAGLNPTVIKLSAFTLGASFAGFAGSFFAARQGLVTPESFTFIESAIILAIVVLGGMGSQLGVILAAVVMILLPEMMREFSEYRMLMFGALMVLMMIWRPQGLLPMQRPHMELRK
jgi:hypothetical protein